MFNGWKKACLLNLGSQFIRKWKPKIISSRFWYFLRPKHYIKQKKTEKNGNFGILNPSYILPHVTTLRWMSGPLKKCSLVFFFFGFFLILSHDHVCRSRTENSNSVQFCKFIFSSAWNLLRFEIFKKTMFFEIFSVLKKKMVIPSEKRKKILRICFLAVFMCSP